MELVHFLVIIALVVIVLLGLLLFRVNTHIQMRVSFNMDDECNIYNQKGLTIFIEKHKRKLTSPSLVVVEINNLMMIYKLQEYKKVFMVKIADLLLKGLKKEEMIGRLAFNKFCIVYNQRKRDDIKELCAKFEDTINSPEFGYNFDIQFRIFYGVNEKPVLKDISLDIRDAEASINYSKLKDKNFYYFSPDVTTFLLKRDNINASKKSAYDEKRIISYIQPKVSLKTGKVCGGEILCRWVDERHKPLYFPDEFVPVFEENGFIKQIDMLMLENACQLLQTLIRKGFSDIVISVNLSKANFESETCLQKIAEITTKYDVPHQNIEFEVTETAIMNSPAYVSDEIMQIRQNGYKVAMDDFGKEYSSLGSLADNPYDTIKLDSIFFKNGLTVDKERYIAETLIRMLSKLNVEIVCEGVEDQQTVDIIGSICEDCVIQGYVFSKPIPLNQFEAFAATQYEFEFEPIPENVPLTKSKKPTKLSKTELDDDRVKELEKQIAEMQKAFEQQKNSQAYRAEGYQQTYGGPNYGGPYQQPYGGPNYGGPYQQPYGGPNYGGPYQQPYGGPNYGGPYQQPYNPAPEVQQENPYTRVEPQKAAKEVVDNLKNGTEKQSENTEKVDTAPKKAKSTKTQKTSQKTLESEKLNDTEAEDADSNLDFKELSKEPSIEDTIVHDEPQEDGMQESVKTDAKDSSKDKGSNASSKKIKVVIKVPKKKSAQKNS